MDTRVRRALDSDVCHGILQVFSNIKSWRHVDRIISLAHRIDALVCFTFTGRDVLGL
jgi:hypothetical protein